MKEWEKEGFLSEEAYLECLEAEMESEQLAEFGMGFVARGGRASEVGQAWRESKMTEQEFGEFQETLQREMHDVDCFCRACQ